MDTIFNEFIFIRDGFTRNLPLIKDVMYYVHKTIKWFCISSMIYLAHLVIEVGVVVYVLKIANFL